MSNDKTPEQPSTRWRDQVRGTKPTFEDHNKQGIDKSLSSLKPASTAPPVDNKPAPKVEQKPQAQTARIEQKPAKFAERIKPKMPPPTPPKGPRK